MYIIFGLFSFAMSIFAMAFGDTEAMRYYIVIGFIWFIINDLQKIKNKLK